MTAGNNGTPDPGSDDPFAYLYRQEGADPGQTAATNPSAQPGVPRTSYNQVRAVGERRPAPPQQQAPYGQQPQQAPQPAYGYPPSQYATQQLPYDDQQGGHRGGGHGGGSGRGQGGGPNSRGLLIGAIAVVAAVSIGIGVAMANGSDGDAATGSTASPSVSAGTSGGSDSSSDPSASSSASSSTNLSTPVDASTLTLAGGAAVASDVPGADAAGGKYVAGMETVGASATWSFTSPQKGRYSLHVSYSVPGTDASSTITVNGSAESRSMNLKNYSKADSGDYEKGWTNSWSVINLDKGQNTVSISCGSSDKCTFYLDQVWLTEGSNG